MARRGRTADPKILLERAQRMEKVTRLRLMNSSFSEIAEATGLTKTGAEKTWYRALTRLPSPEDRRRMRQIVNEEQRIGKKACFDVIDDPKATAEEKMTAVRSLVAIWARQSKMWGLDAPTQTHIDVEDLGAGHKRIPLEWIRKMIGQGRQQTEQDAIAIEASRRTLMPPRIEDGPVDPSEIITSKQPEPEDAELVIEERPPREIKVVDPSETPEAKDIGTSQGGQLTLDDIAKFRE